MKPILFYIIVSILFLLIPLSGVGLLGTMVTDKYQVEHARIFLDIDSKKLTEKEIQKKSKEIDNLEKSVKSVNRQQILMFGIATIGLISGITLLRNKKRIIKNTLHNTVYSS
ncbi:hypothetical protein [Aequorivita marina]|uniref:hypothetical protein n=1 Tax=Aequorivita marina TaxID=3073654 RepID=UPI0028771790|nr:hypothetical protein [Aequorivita sp. S2608]MDS1298726.1 hypothetical protein [Aequorivita sp. S2608]